MMNLKSSYLSLHNFTRESYERPCDWSQGWDAAEKHYEQRLDKMAEEYEALLKSAKAERDFAEKQLDRIRGALA